MQVLIGITAAGLVVLAFALAKHFFMWKPVYNKTFAEQKGMRGKAWLAKQGLREWFDYRLSIHHAGDTIFYSSSGRVSGASREMSYEFSFRREEDAIPFKIMIDNIRTADATQSGPSSYRSVGMP